MDFDAFVHDIVSNGWQVHGAQVYCGGELTHSFGDTCDTKYPIYSATKSILSVAVGIAWDQGRIELQRSILDYLPEGFVAQMTQSQRDAYRIITLHRLLTMSVEGYPFRPESDSYLR
ncbi:MAG: serine hydrolase, partial [Faecousia sp.]